MAAPNKSKPRRTAIIIIRHAERIDDHRIPGGFVSNAKQQSPKRDWRYDTEAGRSRPWDPPLSYGGIDQSEKFGRLLPRMIENLKLPPLGAVYTSPVLRCAETALAAVRAHDVEVFKMDKEKKDAKELAMKNKAKNAAKTNGKKAKTPTTTRGTINFGGAMGQTTLGTINIGSAARTTKASPKGPATALPMATTLGTAHVHARAPSISLGNYLGYGGSHGDDASVRSNLTSLSGESATDACTDTHVRKAVRVRLEQGLMECIHKQWYEQWCHCVDVPVAGEGVLGEHRMKLDDTQHKEEEEDGKDTADGPALHPVARCPVTYCFPDPSDFAKLLGGVVRSYREPPGSGGVLPPDRDRDQRILPRDMMDRIDTTDHLTPFETIPEEYVYESSFETGVGGLNRQHKSIRAIAERHAGETILCVSHYVPCAHLFGRLTGRDFMTEHGKAEYTSFSIYVHSDGREGEKHKDWKPLVVNDRRHLKPAQPAKKKFNLRSRLYGF